MGREIEEAQRNAVGTSSTATDRGVYRTGAAMMTMRPRSRSSGVVGTNPTMARTYSFANHVLRNLRGGPCGRPGTRAVDAGEVPQQRMSMPSDTPVERSISEARLRTSARDHRDPCVTALPEHPTAGLHERYLTPAGCPELVAQLRHVDLLVVVAPELLGAPSGNRVAQCPRTPVRRHQP
jgi:hypothetical protein